MSRVFWQAMTQLVTNKIVAIRRNPRHHNSRKGRSCASWRSPHSFAPAHHGLHSAAGKRLFPQSFRISAAHHQCSDEDANICEIRTFVEVTLRQCETAYHYH